MKLITRNLLRIDAKNTLVEVVVVMSVAVMLAFHLCTPIWGAVSLKN